MIIAVIAMALLVFIGIFRTVGLASAQDRDAKAVGILYKRLRVAFHAALWGGPAILILGESIGWKWMYDLGIIIWIMAGPLFLLEIIAIVRFRRHNRDSKRGEA